MARDFIEEDDKRDILVVKIKDKKNKKEPCKDEKPDDNTIFSKLEEKGWRILEKKDLNSNRDTTGKHPALPKKLYENLIY